MSLATVLGNVPSRLLKSQTGEASLCGWVPRTQDGLAPSWHPAFAEMMTSKLSRPRVLSQTDPSPSPLLPALPARTSGRAQLQGELERTARSSTVIPGGGQAFRSLPHSLCPAWQAPPSCQSPDLRREAGQGDPQLGQGKATSLPGEGPGREDRGGERGVCSVKSERLQGTPVRPPLLRQTLFQP